MIIVQDIQELQQAITGDVEVSELSRAQYATDASNYRVPPQLVVFPKSDGDVRAALEWSRRYSVPVTSRGGGTSTCGNSIGPGMVLEFSRYMNQILAINPEARTARVQAGVVMSDLQAAAAQYGLRFGPDPSTQNRATFGGMIGNNACGPHAVAYGKTANNVLSLHCIDGAGREFEAATLDDLPKEIARPLTNLVEKNLSEIRTHMGRFSRQVSGYSLEWLLPENGRDFAKMLVGTEGTLVAVTEATLALVPIAGAPNLVVLGYPDMPTAADAVPALLKHRPLAIEGMDAELVEAVRRAKGSVPELPEGKGWLMVEVGALEGEDPAQVPARARALAADAGTDAVLIREAGPEATTLWRIRADGAGLGGRTPQGTQAWPGWEDSAVPPENLGPYLRDLQALMDERDLHGLMYGHFGDGCVHVRIDFPLHTPEGPEVFREFLERATDCAVRYGGSLSGEHGDGRGKSELLAKMYTPRIRELFAQVKAIFDPEGLMNPGVLVSARPIDADLRRPFAAEVDYAGGFHFHEHGGSFTAATHVCTGVGKCRADNALAGGWMCPSYQATKDEKDVTRGRMRILQEVAQAAGGRRDLIKGFADKSVRGALDLCLGCKACGKDCPTGVDVARFKSEALYRGYKGKLRPRTHYLLGNLPTLARLATAIPLVPTVANAALGVTPLRKVVFKLAGLDTRRQMPGFTKTRFERTVHGRSAKLSAVQSREPEKYVMLWADSFSKTLDTRGAQAMVELLQRHGYTVLIPPDDACCGLTWITTGQLDTAKAKLEHLLSVLAPFAASGIPIVGVEPSCTAVLRDDLLDLLPDDARSSLVSGMTVTLAELLTDERFAPEELHLPDLSGVTVVAQPHCHHYSVMGWEADAKLLRAAGAKLEILTGCCGLAGNFGMEQGHYDVSVKVAERQLLPALTKAGPSAVYLADGFSCRTQAQQLVGKQGMHLAQLLLEGAREELVHL